jgi:hypothetical protein
LRAAHLPSRDADLLGEAVEHPLHRELGLVRPKPRNAPHTGLLVRAAIDSTSIAGRGTARWRDPPTLEHLHPTDA